MNNSQEFQFINGAPKRLLLIIEPTSSEFWIESRATVKILLEGANVPATFDVEYLAGGMVFYASEGSRVRVFKNGCQLPQGKCSRRMASRLTRQGQR
ncbi:MULTISPECIES: hypothetical protein [Pseudomonas]|jgi:hypothetical protein|uniref:Uncharacterized protein n=1 Tax=Pseudomonas urmiensis TaxID=2745493 RepID=A0A923G1R2_9PSED|nr:MULTISPECIES: hypothetical protein [Pseudomonas]MBV4535646.1 hypothetical protein [Pseudomonas urmiensis]MDD2146743.1 hypothetical protein [Pseudomonas putida]UVL87093.1 hypothetical protein LOY51_14905 [Pseudomonas sichuanensis]WNN39181.1 hypothetical protein RIN61_23795 [Pseudomonas inefficax]HDS1705608.1 hypothetical protein [Pseudomonas putida]